MKKVLIPLLCIMTLMTFCSFFGLFSGGKISEKRQIIGKINQRLSIKFKKEYGLNFMGITEAAIDRKYDYIGFDLCSKRILSKEEGRILLIKCSEDILASINSYPGFDKYLLKYPFTGDNIIVNIYVQPPQKSYVPYPNIAIFLYINNILQYDMRSPTNDLETVSLEKETYDEAKKIVEAQMNSQQYHDGY